jgi:uncharacterized protein (TIGR03437 family)
MCKSILLFLAVPLALPAQTLTTVVTFNGANGTAPTALIQGSDGNYYGTTEAGGSGYGTLFQLTAAGTLTTIYTFASATGNPQLPGPDGAAPFALTQGADGNFYGTTSLGGTFGNLREGGGTIFKITPTGVLTTLHRFTMSDGYYPSGSLLQASDGNFYGVTTAGGPGIFGTLFQITPSGTLTVLHNFSPEEGNPVGGLVQGKDGNLYGCSGKMVYKLTLAGVLTSFYNFSGSGSSGPLIIGSNGNFYGATSESSSSSGTIFQLTPGGVLKTIYEFSSSQGWEPFALLQASDGNFYGLLQDIGPGSIFKVTPAGVMTTMQNFNGVDGSYMGPGELMQGSDGNLHGGTLDGGSYNDGVLFTLTLNSEVQPPSVVTGSASMVTNHTAMLSASINPNGGDTEAGFLYSTGSSMTNAKSVKQDVGSSPGTALLSLQVVGLTPATTYYYQAFASNSAGTVNGAVASFTTAELAGYAISGVVTLQGVGLPGVTVSINGVPAITQAPSGQYSEAVTPGGDYIVTPFAVGYTFTPPSVTFNNLSANQVANFTAAAAAPSTAFFTLVNFSGANGVAPSSGITLASDGNFYGTTQFGGANNVGTVFQLTPSGTLTTLHSFDETNGSSPFGGLVQASNGNFYGNTLSGGGGNGTLYRITPQGAFTSLLSFSSSGQNVGYNPIGTLVQATDGNLYGVTAGMFGVVSPTVFRISLSGALTPLYTFSPGEGTGPQSGLLQASDGNFYGTLEGNDISATPGLVFKMTPSGAVTPLYMFCQQQSCADGISPTAPLIQGTDGNLYGTAEDGPSQHGVVFKLTLGGAYSILYAFDEADGASPNGLLQATDGNFYGTTKAGGPAAAGTLFQLTPTGTLTTLHAFDGSDGVSASGSLIQGPDGALYGTTQQGGASDQGTVFGYALPNVVPAIAANSGVVSGASFQAGIAPNSWITIRGTNFSLKTDTWSSAIVNGVLPQSLDGVSVNVGGSPAYVAYVSPQQINALAPNISAGNTSVTVTNSAGTSTAVSVTAQAAQPAFFLWGAYAVATRSDYSLAVKNGTFPGVTTVPAKPGDTIILWGTGFGETSPAAAVGTVVPAGVTYNTASPVNVTVGGKPATVLGAALAPGYAGLYQVAIQIPSNLVDGDYAVVATVAGVESPSTTLITVQQ